MKIGPRTKAHLSITGSSPNAIIVFNGMSSKFGGIPRYEFKNTLTKIAPNWNKHFFIDHYGSWYHDGLYNISNNIDETANYIRDQICGYDNIIMMGVSAGGYAAILFGSLLKASIVLVFQPQTKISKRKGKYFDLKTVINKNTKYVMYGDVSIKDSKDLHHISHCYNIMCENAELHLVNKLNLRDMRDNGELDKIIIKNLVSLE